MNGGFPGNDNRRENRDEEAGNANGAHCVITANCSSSKMLSCFSTNFLKTDVLGNGLPLPNSFQYATRSTLVSKNLNDLIPAAFEEEIFSNNFLQILLLQITTNLDRLHEQDTFHGSLSASSIYFLKDKYQIVLIGETNIEAASVENDMVSLANLHCLLLTKGKCPEFNRNITSKHFQYLDSEIAFDLVQKMSQSNSTFDTKKSLQHPYYWTAKQKVNFLNESFDKIQGKSKTDAESLLSSNSIGVIPSGGWIKKLELTKQEKSRLADETVSTNIIMDLVTKQHRKRKFKYKEDAIFDLLRFFRNKYTHMGEADGQIKACFENGPDGYWRFFSSRYPKLFMHVYNLNVNIFEEIAHNKPLPKMEFDLISTF